MPNKKIVTMLLLCVMLTGMAQRYDRNAFTFKSSLVKNAEGEITHVKVGAYVAGKQVQEFTTETDGVPESTTIDNVGKITEGDLNGDNLPDVSIDLGYYGHGANDHYYEALIWDQKQGLFLRWPSNVTSVVSQLNNKYGQSQHAPKNDSYHQRYLPAAVLKGATPENGYSPQHPYTIEMKASVNKHRDMQFMGAGRVVYLYILGKGWDTNQRSVEIIKPEDSELHQVFNCPALYTLCKTIRGTWQGLK